MGPGFESLRGHSEKHSKPIVWGVFLCRIFISFQNALLKKCGEFMYIHKLTYETVLSKYGENDITAEENETLRVRYGEFVNKVAEKAKDFGMGEE